MAILYINFAPCVKLKNAFFKIIYRKSRGAYSLLVIISVCTYLYIGEKRLYETRDRQFQLTTVIISYENSDTLGKCYICIIYVIISYENSDTLGKCYICIIYVGTCTKISQLSQHIYIVGTTRL